MFKIGDRAKVKNEDNHFYPVGTIVTIEDIVRTDELICKGDDLPFTQILSSCQLEKLETNEETKMNNSVIWRLINNDILSIVINYGEPIVIDSSNHNFQSVLSALKKMSDDPERKSNRGTLILQNELDWLVDQTSDKKRVEKFLYGNTNIVLENNMIKYRGEVLHGTLVTRILRMLDEGFDAQPLVNFLDRLQKNPSYRVREQLYQFLDYGRNAITPDGCFLAYKYVNNDLKSCHPGVWRDGKFIDDERYDHSIGAKPSMPRERVNDDPNHTCSSGLHVCSRKYLDVAATSGGNRIVVCKVDPADVVSVPTDYNNTKMRTCGYEVVGELEEDKVKSDFLATRSIIDDFRSEYQKGYDQGKSDFEENMDYYPLSDGTNYRNGYVDGWNSGAVNNGHWVSSDC